MLALAPEPLLDLPAELLPGWQRLFDLLYAMESAVVAFSGGVDSALVAAAAQRALAKRMLAVTILSPVESRADSLSALETSAALGFPHRLLHLNDLDDPLFLINSPERCYHCKRRRLQVLVELAQAEGYAYVLDGSNASDLADYRPGRKALAELGVRSPLLEARIDKEQVRGLARALGLPCAERSSAPCLATRIPYGIPVTAQALQRIGAAETFLERLGFSHVRVRDYGAMARLEVSPHLIQALVDARALVTDQLKALGYHHIAIDIEGYRSGSLNESLDL